MQTLIKVLFYLNMFFLGVDLRYADYAAAVIQCVAAIGCVLAIEKKP